MPTSITLRLPLRPVFMPMAVRSYRSPARRREEHQSTTVISGTDRNGHVGGQG